VAELHLQEEGVSEGPPVMFVNSLGTDLSVWDGQADRLADVYRLLRYDQRGQGRSPTPPGPYSIDQLGIDALALLDRLGIDRVSLAGISLGGAVCMWLASEAPERIERLVLCCTSTSFGPADAWLQRAEQVRGKGIDSIADPVIERWFTPGFRDREPETVERFRRGLIATDPIGYAACCEAIAALDLRDRLRAIPAPAAVIAAPHDPAAPVDQLKEIADGIDGAELTILTDGAHLANVERADDVSEILLKHLAKEGT
jgi:3-oxoadipate enol-lactonase